MAEMLGFCPVISRSGPEKPLYGTKSRITSQGLMLLRQSGQYYFGCDTAPLKVDGAGLDLFARPDLVSVPPAVLLQRAQLASPPTHRCRDRLHACRQRLCAHRRLAAGADLGRSALARRPASGPRSLCPAVLSRVRRLRAVLPLEPDAGRVRHRSGIPLASRPQTAL